MVASRDTLAIELIMTCFYCVYSSTNALTGEGLEDAVAWLTGTPHTHTLYIS